MTPIETRKEFIRRNMNLIGYLYPGTHKVYGPYLNTDGRYRVVLYDGKNRRTRQYCKLKMEIKLEHRIEEPDTVDHKNGKYRDDRYENLQILVRSDHARKDALKLPKITCVCPVCKSSFQPTVNQIKNANNRKKAGPFCNRRCSGIYGATVQNGGSKLKNTKIAYELVK